MPIPADRYALSTNRDSTSPVLSADTELTQYPIYFPVAESAARSSRSCPDPWRWLKCNFEFLKGHPFVVHPEMRSLRQVIPIELLPERPDKFNLADTGCTVINCMHRFNIRIKTINYDG
jgi:hypothetical protein